LFPLRYHGVDIIDDFGGIFYADGFAHGEQLFFRDVRHLAVDTQGVLADPAMVGLSRCGRGHTPGEILQLPGDDALLIVGGFPSYRAKKVMSYQDNRFNDRACLPAPDSEAEQAAELFASSVWTNACESQYRPMPLRNSVDDPMDTGAGKARQAEIERATVLANEENNCSVKPEIQADGRDFEAFDLLPDMDEASLLSKEFLEQEEWLADQYLQQIDDEKREIRSAHVNSPTG
jgi:hypothetical protein